MRRRLWLWGVALLLAAGGLAAGLTWYLNTVFLPGPARQWAATWLAEQTGRRVALGALRFNVWEGVTVEHVTLFDDRRYGIQPFLEVDRITVSCLYLPLLKERRLIIPTLRLVHPKIHLVRDAAATWNLESLRCFHRPTAPAPTREPPLRLLLSKLVLVDGELLVEDQHGTPGLAATLTRINLRAGLTLPHAVVVKGTAQWQTMPVTSLLLQGTWDLAKRRGQGAVTARGFPLDNLRPYLPPAAAGAFHELGGIATVTLKVAGQPEQYQATATVATSGCRWQWREIHGWGDVTLTARGALRHQGGWAWAAPALAAQLHGVTLHAPSPWPTIEQLKGTVRITPQGLESPALTALVNGLPLRAHGTLLDPDHPYQWRSPKISAEFMPDAPLHAIWNAAAPYRRGWLATMQLAGAGQIRAVLQGAWLKPHLVTTLHLTDAQLTTPALGTVEHLHGRLLIEPDLLTATEVRGVWRQTPVQLDGTLVNFTTPEIDCTVRWGEVVAEAAVAIEGRRVTLTNITTTYRRSRVETTGELTLGSDAVEATLHHDFMVDLADAAAWFPAQAETLRAWHPSGIVTGHAFIHGPLGEPARWECGLKGRARQVAVRGFHLDNLAWEYRQLQGEASIPTLTADSYGGALTASGTLSLQEPRHPFRAQWAVTNLELGRLAQDTPWRDRNLSGLVTAQGTLYGYGDTRPGSLEAEARVQVINGRLFEIPVLRGLSDLLGAPALRRVTFRDAAGTFAWRQQVLSTADLTFYSDLVTLTAVGSLGPQEAVNAHVVTSIDPAAFEHSPQFARFAGQFLQKAGYLIGEVKISGTLSEPKYEVVPVSPARLLKEQVFERLRGLFEGLWR